MSTSMFSPGQLSWKPQSTVRTFTCRPAEIDFLFRKMLSLS